MSATVELWSLSASDVLRSIYNNLFSVEEYAKALLAHIEARDNEVMAWEFLDPDLVIAQARRLDRIPRHQRGQLHGVAIGIKDVIDTEDMPTEHGSPLYRGNQPNADAPFVTILREAGALILGKTTTTEFTIPNFGPPTTNPHDLYRTPGGSSAGSAAAVADFQVPLSFGTQTGGSVIRPASYTGTYAMKPTFNTISTQGIKRVSPALDTVGYFARSLEDLQLITNMFDFTNDVLADEIMLQEVKVGFVKTPFWPSAGLDTIDAMEKAPTILRQYGVTVEEVDFPYGFEEAATLQRFFEVMLKTDAHASLLREYLMDQTNTALDPEIRTLIENASQISPEEKRHAFDHFAALRIAFDDISTRYSALITPSAPDSAPQGIDDMGSAQFNFIWTALHMPVIQIPAFMGWNGMPVGISIVGRRFGDQYLLSIARLLKEPLMFEGGWARAVAD